jgi:hypothetical protein
MPSDSQLEVGVISPLSEFYDDVLIPYCDFVAVDQLSPAPRLNLAIYLHLAVLNQLLGLPAGIDNALPFEELVELNEFARFTHNTPAEP